MIQTLSILNYRSIKRLSLSLDVLNVITGSNASGKTNLYNALRLLSRSCYGNVNSALAI
ncbi:AAA family ATPase [Vibrio cholerae]|nr:AAA family ATPase [Vibrio cholerae]